MKVIFIVLDFGLAIRNILKNELHNVLKSNKDVQIVIFSPIKDKAFIEEYGGNNTVIELNPYHRNIFTKTLYSLMKNIWEKKTNIFSFKDKRAKKNRFKYLFIKIILIFFDSSCLLSILRKINLFFFHNSTAKLYFEKYKPDLVFYTTMYSKGPCLELEAQKRNVKTVCLIHSWDNPTTKGPFRMSPDKLIVWNSVLKKEVIKYHDFSTNNIYISGIPQFDVYFDKSRFVSKESFFNKNGLDLNKKLLTYATSTSGLVPFSPEIVEILYSAIQNNRFISPCQLLIRLHPRDIPERYIKFNKLEGVFIQTPGRQANIPDKWHPTEKDMLKLAETIFYSDVIINIASTITVDAVALDKPVINVAFDGHQTNPYRESCRRYYDYNHFSNILKHDGVKVAYSKEDFIKMINAYIVNPSLDTDGRKRIRKEQCWKLDGSAGKRIAKYLLKQ